MMGVQSQFIANRAIDVRSDGDRLIVSSFSGQRGFWDWPLGPGQPGHVPALSVMEGDPLDVDALSPHDVGPLWMAGLLIRPTERTEDFAPSVFAATAESFRALGYETVPACVTPAMVTTLASYYREQVATGRVEQIVDRADRYIMHNDPAGRVVQRALLPAIEAMVGKSLRPSYSFASLYHEGATLRMHRDRPQCAYTLSLAIDHRPLPMDGVSPWPLTIYPEQNEGPQDCFLPLGGGLLFKGRELKHGRKALPPGQTCWTLLLHYVDADFDGDLD